MVHIYKFFNSNNLYDQSLWGKNLLSKGGGNSNRILVNSKFVWDRVVLITFFSPY